MIDAIASSAAKHRNQRRKDADASPYINYSIALARVLAVEAQVGERVPLLAAVLHDTVEDTDTTEAAIHAHCGAEVAAVVMEVIDDKSLSKAQRNQAQVAHAPTMSRAARLVKLADKSCNLRDVADAPPADGPLLRRRDYFDWAAQVVQGLRGTHAALEELFDHALAKRP